MIRKFSVTNTQSNQSGSVSTSEAPSTTGSGPIASPTSQLESQISSTDQDSKKLYAQSLESTENSVVNEQSQTMSALVDPLLYPIGSEHDTSTDGEIILHASHSFPVLATQSSVNKFLLWFCNLDCQIE